MYSEGSQIQEETSQKGLGVSVLGHIKDVTGDGLEQCGLVYCVMSRVPSGPWSIPWFCDSVNKRLAQQQTFSCHSFSSADLLSEETVLQRHATSIGGQGLGGLAVWTVGVDFSQDECIVYTERTTNLWLISIVDGRRDQ